MRPEGAGGLHGPPAKAAHRLHDPHDRRQDAIFDAIQAFRRTFAGFHRRLAAAAGPGVSASDAFVLHHIAHEADVTPGQIAALTGLTSGAVTSVIDRLENAGLVQRRPGTHDRRVVLVSLRPGAEAQLAAAMERVHRDVHGLFSGWDVAHIEDLAALLEALDLDGTAAAARSAGAPPPASTAP